MRTENGYLLISLDFELFWGLFDAKCISEYDTNIRNVHTVIPRLINLADTYNITLTFATVGFLFAENKEELINAFPSIKPTYSNDKFNPYSILKSVGNTQEEDPFHFAASTLDIIKNNGNHEIASHTFSHFYVNEDGQTLAQFEADLKAALAIAERKGIAIKSIVFPRNQINDAYLEICVKYGIICFRGTEKHWMFNTHDTKKLDKPFYKAFRLLDAYCNLSGYNTYSLNDIKNCHKIVNLPSSKFFRPYTKPLGVLEPLRINRVKKGLTKAAKNNEIYHMWWHPHNFGENTEENFKNLETIFKHYKELHDRYGFQSVSMQQLAESFLTSQVQ